MSENNLKHWQEKIKEKRKNTDFRDFLMEIPSWLTFNFYRNNGIISNYSESERKIDVMKSDDFHNDTQEIIGKGVDYDDSMSFFDNYKIFTDNIVYPALVSYGGNENADYASMIYNSKNIYLSTAVINGCENVFHSLSVKDYCNNVHRSVSVWNHCDNVFSSVGIIQSYNIFYSRFINNSNNIWFSTNLVGCSECILCDNLENSSYYIKNKKYSKEDYFIEKEKILSYKTNFDLYYKMIPKKGININSDQVIGNSIFNSENVENGYFVNNVSNGRNLILVGGIDGNQNMYDVFPGGSPRGNDFYGVMGANGDNLYCSLNILWSSNMFYSHLCNDSSYCFGCIGLKNKSYCILNKQYSKDEWHKKVDEIFKKMDNEGTLGGFFPASHNKYYFNDTMAYLIGDFSKEEVIEKGYMWRDEVLKVDIPENAEVIISDELDQFQSINELGKWNIDISISDKIIQDINGNFYKITPEERIFLEKYGLPLPEIHWSDNIRENFRLK